jgi:NAD(P)-dependent dehydrogenase (short-subunit alcohol dehydrogenase family)
LIERQAVNGRLAGKTAFISGASSGIGQTAAILFARNGARVAVASRTQETGHETLDMINSDGGTGIFIQTDVTDPQSVERSILRCVEEFGELNIIYNNAGGSSPGDGPVTEVELETFWRILKVDLFGTWLCCRYGIPHLIRGGGGSVINTSSIVALNGLPGRDAYTAAKGAIAALTRSMAAEYADANVRVNAIAPGITRTPRVEKIVQEMPQLQTILARHRLGLGSPIDIAHAALYLASEESRNLTGHVLVVDSGFSTS